MSLGGVCVMYSEVSAARKFMCLVGWCGGNVFVRLAAGSRWFDFLVNCLLMFFLAAHGVAAAWLWWLFCGCVLCENSIVCRCTN